MLRLSLRELLLVTLVVGLVIGWWAERVRRLRGIELRAAAIEFVLRPEGWTIHELGDAVRFRREGADDFGYEYGSYRGKRTATAKTDVRQ